MQSAQALKQLEALGTAQNRKVYARHGVTGPSYGVSYAHLGKLAREWQGQHELALALWASGVHDARILATMIADPERLRAKDLQAWTRGLDNYVLTDAVAKLAARSPDARALVAKWTASGDEWTGTSGWGILAWLLHSGVEFPANELRTLLRTIEKGIHGAKNRVRYAMNGALIGIGIASEELREEALAAARRIGMVEVDHGQTGCQTPDAASYIQKVIAHRAKKRGPTKPARKTATKTVKKTVKKTTSKAKKARAASAAKR